MEPREPRTEMTVKVRYLNSAEEYSIRHDSWDMSIQDFKRMCKQMALAMGFGPDNVADYFNEEE